jgi:HEAT repeat protein
MAAYSNMLAKDEFTAAMELVAALVKRGRSKYFTHFVAHLSSRSSSIDARIAGDVIGISMLRGLPPNRWSAPLIGKLRTSGPGRFVTARVFLAKRLPAGRQIILKALEAPDKADRERAIIALGETRSIGARRLLRTIFKSTESLNLQLLCAEYLKRAVAARVRSALVKKSSEHEDPLIRYRAARQFEWLPGKQRRQLARRWLESETDEVVKSSLRPWL